MQHVDPSPRTRWPPVPLDTEMGRDSLGPLEYLILEEYYYFITLTSSYMDHRIDRQLLTLHILTVSAL